MDEYRTTNLANWDERVAGHMAPDGYGVDRLVDDPDHITTVVRHDAAKLGSVDGLTMLHSQCHIGSDTLSWARLGATVTGLDFSPKAIAAARSLAVRMGIDATFVETEFYDSPRHIEATFDLVYTSVGAICWLPDITKWAEIMAGFVKPGGRFWIRDSHPALMALDDGRDDTQLIVRYPYFHQAKPINFSDTESYLGTATLENPDSYSWAHSIADVINALLDAGLVLERFAEYQHLDWQFFTFMEQIEDEVWALPENVRDNVPTQFSILASKPA